MSDSVQYSNTCFRPITIKMGQTRWCKKDEIRGGKGRKDEIRVYFIQNYFDLIRAERQGNTDLILKLRCFSLKTFKEKIIIKWIGYMIWRMKKIRWSATYSQSVSRNVKEKLHKPPDQEWNHLFFMLENGSWCVACRVALHAGGQVVCLACSSVLYQLYQCILPTFTREMWNETKP